jgi:hypothetical protein
MLPYFTIFYHNSPLHCIPIYCCFCIQKPFINHPLAPANPFVTGRYERGFGPGSKCKTHGKAREELNPILFNRKWYPLVMTNIAIERSTMLLIGKPSISMGHLYHGYVTNNQRVSILWLFCGWFTIAERLLRMVAKSCTVRKSHLVVFFGNPSSYQILKQWKIYWNNK